MSKDKRTKADLLQEIEVLKSRCRNYDGRLAVRLDEVETLEKKVKSLELEKSIVIDENHELFGQITAFQNSMETVLKAQCRVGPFNDDVRPGVVSPDYINGMRKKL